MNYLHPLTYELYNKALVVVYKEEERDGFIITAFFTSKMEQVLKREMVWRK